jgi:hypothetical protein
VPLLSLFKDNRPLLDNILADLGMQPALNLHFEYTVGLPAGRGKASHTDLLVQSPSQCLAIEAKWTEPMYEPVSKWLPRLEAEDGAPTAKPANRHEVLEGWLSLLEVRAVRNLVVEQMDDCIYQMVHRAASACHDKQKEPLLAYFKFTPSPNPQAAGVGEYKEALTLLHSVLGRPAAFPFFLVEIQMLPTTEFRSIASLPKGQARTGNLVKQALVQAKLFDFTSYRIETIRRQSDS